MQIEFEIKCDTYDMAYLYMASVKIQSGGIKSSTGVT